MSLNEKKLQNSEINKMLSQNADNDDIMCRLRKLELEVSLLKEQLNANNYECDILKELLLCSSKNDVQMIIEEFLPYKQTDLPTTPEEQRTLAERIQYLRTYEIQEHLEYAAMGLQITGKYPDWVTTTLDNSSCMSKQNKEAKTIAIKVFPYLRTKISCLPRAAAGWWWSLNEAFTTLDSVASILARKDERYGQLVHYIFPVIIPVAELSKKYLESKEGEDVPAFVNSIHQYLWAFWKRDIEVQVIKNMSYMSNSLIYHNKNRTLISFTLNFLKKYIIEFRLSFDRLSFIPHTVQYQEWDGQLLPQELSDALEEIKTSLLTYQVSEVLDVNLATEQEAAKSSQGTDSVSDSATTIFELFDNK